MRASGAALYVACILFVSVAAAAGNPAARYETLSAPDCASPGNIIAEAAPAPPNATHMRVQYMGDPGTDELRNEVANIVSWDVGQYTGLHTDEWVQRGYRSQGPPASANAFQLACDSAGFFINTATFSHTVPIFGAGPSASVARRLEPGLPAFTGPASTLMLEARIAMPWVYTPTPPTGEGTAQVSLAYYAQDETSGATFAHVIGVFDNRDVSLAGNAEIVGHDGEVAFAGSPLLDAFPDGHAVEFVRVSPHSARMRFVNPWSEPAFFRAEIPYETFRRLLQRLKSSLPSMSTEPMDYRIILFGVLGEVVPGTGQDHNVSLGASVSQLQLLRSNARHIPR
jgi:hypothetical protein